ncbi:hypothetical protein [Halalkalicoccus tibetensis]|uniref:Uncharacterized protein n=1 Tax=Halalkalicoccus tibetensis TaxID=175632 RepID=A0ABD5VCY5_9EURY
MNDAGGEQTMLAAAGQDSDPEPEPEPELPVWERQRRELLGK